MKNKMILALFIIVGVFGINFASDVFNNRNSYKYAAIVSSKGLDDYCAVRMDEEDVFRAYKKYKDSISDIFEKYHLDYKNLKEDKNDSEFVSRIVCMDDEELANIDDTWFGIIYDDEDIPIEVVFYLEGEFDLYLDSDKSFTIKNTLIDEVGDVFFPRTKFNKDVEGFFNNASSDPGSNTAEFIYKKGSVIVSLNGNKVSFKFNLFK